MDLQRIQGNSAPSGAADARKGAHRAAGEAFSDILAEIREDWRRLAAGVVGTSREPLAPSNMLEKIRENRAQAAEKAKEAASVEVVRRLLPDGTIRISKYEGGRLAKVRYSTPDKIAVPDYRDPSWHESTENPKAGTNKKMKLVTHRSILDGLFS